MCNILYRTYYYNNYYILVLRTTRILRPAFTLPPRTVDGWSVGGWQVSGAWECERDGPTPWSTFWDLSVLCTHRSRRFVLWPSPFQSIVKQQHPARHLHRPRVYRGTRARAPHAHRHKRTRIVHDDDRGRAPSRV